jgi:hypothetical protein
MRNLVVVPIVMAVALLLTVAATRSSESDQVRDRAKMLQKEAAELTKAGRSGEAEKVAQKANELSKAAEALEDNRSPTLEQNIEILQGNLKDLLDMERRMKESGTSEKDLAGVRQRVVHTERELDLLRRAHRRELGARKGVGPMDRPMPEMMAGLEEAGRRINHLRAAAENLRVAGVDDLARNLMEKAEMMEREVREAKMGMLKDAERREVEELRREIGRLRDELSEVRQRIKELERGKK